MSTQKERRPAGNGAAQEDQAEVCTESNVIATRLAASPLFPVPAPKTTDGRQVRESVAHTTVDGDTLAITVTDADRTVRRYTAVVRPDGGPDD